MKEFNQKLGILLADEAHKTIVSLYDEPLNGDDIEEIVKSFEKQLKELNGD